MLFFFKKMFSFTSDFSLICKQFGIFILVLILFLFLQLVRVRASLIELFFLVFISCMCSYLNTNLCNNMNKKKKLVCMFLCMHVSTKLHTHVFCVFVNFVLESLVQRHLQGSSITNIKRNLFCI